MRASRMPFARTTSRSSARRPRSWNGSRPRRRRHQKIIEEAPTPALSPAARSDLAQRAVRAVVAAGYENIGTLEFLVDAGGNAYFIEINCRIQVEHPVTEMLTGIDLVTTQIRIAGGEPLGFGQADVVMRGHAIECRINAEDPALDFRPGPGLVTRWQPPLGEGIRIDTHVAAGTTVTPFYDSLLAKVVVADGDRPAAIARMRRALADFDVQGVPTTIAFHRRVLEHPDFVAGRVHTRWAEEDRQASGGPRE